MKKFTTLAAITILTLSLGGCFDFTGEGAGPDETPSNSGMTTYQEAEFAMEVPQEWQVFTRDEFTSDIPQDTLVVFRNNIKNETFTANVNITRRALHLPEASLDLAKETINRQSNGLASYTELKKETHKIAIGEQSEDTLVSYFQASLTTSDPQVQYIQTYAANGNNAYIITGSFDPKEEQNTVQTIENIVKSFRLK